MSKKEFAKDIISKNKNSYSSNIVKRCYEGHKPLKVADFQIYGGSCSHPIVHDADIYIGFDHSMSFKSLVWPWEPQPEKVPVEVLFPISDMCAPKDVVQFTKMIEWVCNQLQAGKKIHAGCIGGHGRTGTFLAAVVKHMTGNEDAITYVRENYCAKAVESNSQIEFLHKHFGIKKVTATKEIEWVSATPSTGNYSGKNNSKSLWPEYDKYSPAYEKKIFKPIFTTKSYDSGKIEKTFYPVSSKKSLWVKTLDKFR